MTLKTVNTHLESSAPITNAVLFSIVRRLSSSVAQHGVTHQQRELCLKLVARLEEQSFDDAKSYHLVNDLLLVSGLPFMVNEKDTIGISAIALEAYRGATGKFLHRTQLDVASRIEGGRSVILSAPTSFGKTLIVEELIARLAFKNIVIVVPTIALIDELRSSYTKYVGDYNIVVSQDQEVEERNLFILTPERVLDCDGVDEVDLFVIDEFYKLSPERNDNRVEALNVCFYKLLNACRLFLMIGPHISKIPDGFTAEYEADFIQSSFRTVTSELLTTKLKPKDEGGRLRYTVDLLNSQTNPVLIYASSPKRAERIALQLAQNTGGFSPSKEVAEFSEWLGLNVHEDWSAKESLEAGIAFHHGRLPRHMSRFIVNAFNDRKLKALVCTSTLMEGVNTSAQHVVIWDHKKYVSNMDFYDFANIRGRAGRLGQYTKGVVHTFRESPKQGELFVDFPWYTQESATLGTLAQLPAETLHDDSAERLEELFAGTVATKELIAHNVGVDANRQVDIVNKLMSLHNLDHMLWDGYPTYEQLKVVCELIYDGLEARRNLAPARSASQLAYFVNRYSISTSIGDLIREEVNSSGFSGDVDEAVRDVFHRVKSLFEYEFPRLLIALQELVNHVLEIRGSSARRCEYSLFAVRIESNNTSQVLMHLREYGVPASAIKKLPRSMFQLESLEAVFAQLRQTVLEDLDLLPYEVRCLKYAIDSATPGSFT